MRSSALHALTRRKPISNVATGPSPSSPNPSDARAVMMPPFVPGRTPRALAVAASTRMPPFRVHAAPPAAPANEPPAVALDGLQTAADADAGLPWLLPPGIDEADPAAASALSSPEGEPTFIDPVVEWETDQLAAFDLDEVMDDADSVQAAPTATDGDDPMVVGRTGARDEAAARESLDARATPPEPEPAPAESLFESDADLFDRLFDELTASAEPGAGAATAAASLPEPIRALATADPRSVEEIANRLERIARVLRERGPSGPLAEEGADPLGALVAGYLLGLAESRTPTSELRQTPGFGRSPD